MTRNLFKNRRNWLRRGSVLIIVIIALIVVATIASGLMMIASQTFKAGKRQPRLTALRTLADAGVQYGYWQFEYNNITLPFTEANHPLGPGAFTVNVSDNSATIQNTIIIVSTANIGSDTFVETRVLDDAGNIPPAAPINFLAAPGNGSVSLTWLPCSSATSYNIFRGTKAGREAAIPVGTTTATSYRDTGLINGSTYFYKVKAVGKAGSSPYSAEASARPANSDLAGTRQVGLGEVNLTTEGQIDWTEYGLDPFDHKSAGGGVIGNFTKIGAATPSVSAGLTQLDWSDGLPTASETGTTTVMSVSGVGDGFSIVAPADTTYRTLRVYVELDHGQSRLQAILSDGSSPTYTDNGLVTTPKVTNISGTYTIAYRAGSAGQSLTVNFTLTGNVGGAGHVYLEGASLF